MSTIKLMSDVYNDYCRPGEKNWFHFPLLALQSKRNDLIVDDTIQESWDDTIHESLDFAEFFINVLIATHKGVVKAYDMWVEGYNDMSQPKQYLYARAALYLAREYQEQLDLQWEEYDYLPQSCYDKIKDMKEELICNIILLYCR